MNSVTTPYPEEQEPLEIIKSARSGLDEINDYVERNPAAAIIQALVIGFGLGLLIRLLEGGEKKKRGTKDVDVNHKPDLEEAKFHLGSILLPFLWPAWQTAREKYNDSAETVKKTAKDARKAAEDLKKSDAVKRGKSKLEEAEKWAAREASLVATVTRKAKEQIFDWLEKEGADLSRLGRRAAKKVEEWVEGETEELSKNSHEAKKDAEKWLDDEALPALETGWKALKKLWS